MAVITWENVNAPSNADAMRGMESAQRGITLGLDRFGQMISNQEAVESARLGRVKNDNTQAFLDEVGKFRTPAELQAAQASGALDQLRARFGTEIDRTAARGAYDARNESLMAQTLAGNKFDQTLRMQGITNPAELQAAKDSAALAPLTAANNMDVARNRSINLPAEQALVVAENSGKLERAPLNNSNALREAKFKQEMAPQLEALTRGETTEKGKVLKDTELSRQVDADVAEFTANHASTTGAMRDSINAFGAKYSNDLVPKNKDGTIAINQMKAPLIANFNKELAKAGLPPLESTESGDTAALNTMLSSLKSKYPAAQVARVAASLPFGLGTAPQAAIGNDLAIQENNARMQAALDKDLENRFGTVANPGNQGELLKVGLESINGITENANKREDFKRELAAFIDKGGIKITGKEGEVSRILPSPDQLQTLINSINQGYLSSSESEINSVLERWVENSETKKGAAQLLENEIRKQTRKSNEIPATAIPASKPAKK